MTRSSSRPSYLRATSLLTALLSPALLLAYSGCSSETAMPIQGAAGMMTAGGMPSAAGGTTSVAGGAAVAGAPVSTAGMGTVTAGGMNAGVAGMAAVAGMSTGGTMAVGGMGGGGMPAVMGAMCSTAAGTNDANLSVRRPEISTRTVAAVPEGNMMRIEWDPLNSRIIAMNQGGNFWVVDPVGNSVTPLNTGLGGGNNCRSMAFAPDGTLFVQCHSGNIAVNIRKGTPDGAGGYMWTDFVASEAYQAGGTNFDHAFNGIVVSPDGMDVYFASGSRTDHGEMEGPYREQPITSAVFKVPAASSNVMLPNDEAGLAQYLFADGTRNTFDLAFNPAGDLIGAENGPDMDLPDEVNFIEQGKHYGFPWRFGAVDNPVLDAGYNGAGNVCLHNEYQAVSLGTYGGYDAGFPAAPGAFTDPIMNMGPDGDKFRVCPDGAPMDASDAGMGLAGITPHKSPLGLNFDVAGELCGDYNSAGFLLTYGAVTDYFQDGGRDLSLMNMTKVGDAYQMTLTQLVAGFEFAPIDGVLVGNKYYTVEFGGGSFTEITLPEPM